MEANAPPDDFVFDVSSPEVEQLVRMALAEDIGTGDVTTLATVSPGRQATGVFRTKQRLTLAGIELLPLIYRLHGGPLVSLELLYASGTPVEQRTTVAKVAGDARTLLECERVSLNFLQRLSGIATLTAAYVEKSRNTRCRVLDTRKTTPGWRKLEKMAVRAGGGVNHRLGLFDAILIKNNHLTAAGGIREAVAAAQATGLDFEIEVRTIAEVDEALAAGASKLLLDNLTPEEARDWVMYIGGRATTELSGNITLETVGEYARTGANFVSSGALTHSVSAADLHFILKLDAIPA